MIFTDEWNIVTWLPTKRIWPRVAALHKKIYVTGGICAGNPFSGGCYKASIVDCYEPDTNTWSTEANMNIARAGHSLVSLHGRLFAIGGYGVDSVEVYDADKDTWTLLRQKLDGRVEGGNDAVLIKKENLMKK